MKQVKLSIVKSYVSHWSWWQGIRELLQNAVDTGKYDVVYGKDWVEIASHGGTLPVAALLMGNTTKEDDEDTIGKFGEGLKVGLLVLTRLGAGVTIMNGDELWTPVFVHDDTFDQEVLAVNITDDHNFPQNVTVRITGIPPEAVKEMVEYFLPLQEREVIIENSVGKALVKTSPRNGKCRLFVNGIFVTDVPGKFKFDYDFKPSAFVLDRDRNTANSFEVKYEASKLLAKCEDVLLLAELACEKFDDLAHFSSQWDRVRNSDRFHYCDDRGEEVSVSLEEKAHDLFLQKNGNDAWPINEGWGDGKKRLVTRMVMDMGYVPVTVTATLHEMVEDRFPLDQDTMQQVLKFDPIAYLESFVKKYGRRLDSKPRRDIERTLETLKIVRGD